ncbi:uncharacterized protein LOC122665835 [Telopea speciosissima]|uniref:uncharacterized protein LOC122665835 n=1 Tax=Telopea speciosissima TaxID=54955 RepID=UPI001CC36B59|nr:uncharacterized protein LOC122665835 [Telopea speciosissima]
MAALLLAFSIFLGIKTNFVVEFGAVMHGLLRAKEMGATKLCIEFDSIAVVEAFRSGVIPWFVRQVWLGLHPYLLAIIWKISHYFREANLVADLLAKTAAKSGVSEPSFGEFPSAINSALLDDALGRPRYRFE